MGAVNKPRRETTVKYTLFGKSGLRVKALDEASSIEPGFPYYLYNAQMTRALMCGGMRDQLIV
jgi:hypothetical protein